MKIKALKKDLLLFLNNHRLDNKWLKAKYLFERDIKYPSLAIELLEPRW